MNRFKAFGLLAIAAFCNLGMQSYKPYLAKWVLTKQCALKVNGSTNINKFSCLIGNYMQPDTLTFYKGSSTADPVRINGSLVLNVESFDCHNPIMTGDLRKTLKSKEHPNLIIRFITSSTAEYNQRPQGVKCHVSIELAGVIKNYDVDYKLVPDGADGLALVGTKKVNFSDFSITPPRKLGGMIRTDNELVVEFNLKVKVID